MPVATGAVLLDALGTLIHLEPVAPRLAARLGIPADDKVDRAVAAEIAYYRAHMNEARDPESLADLRQRCAGLLSRELGVEVTVDDLLAALEFTAYPEVAGTLAELRRRGLRLVVVSNWDSGLSEVLDRTGLLRLLDGVVTSAETGAGKPDPAIFRRALEIAGCDASRAVHFGDTAEDDVEGARAAGIQPMLVDRSGLSAGSGGTVTSLAAAPAVIDQRELAAIGMTGVDDVPEPEPRRVGWGIGRVLMGIGMMIVAIIFASSIAVAVDSDFDSPAFTRNFLVLQAVVMIGVPIAMVWPGSIGDRLWKLGLRMPEVKRKGRFPWRAVGVGAAAWGMYLLASIILNEILHTDQEDIVDQIGGGESTLMTIIAGLLIVVSAPISEEIVFRGFVLRGLWNGMGFWLAAVLSSAAWAALHLGDANVEAALQLFVLGMLLAWTVKRTNSIWPAVGVHALNNLIAFSLLL